MAINLSERECNAIAQVISDWRKSTDSGRNDIEKEILDSFWEPILEKLGGGIQRAVVRIAAPHVAATNGTPKPVGAICRECGKRYEKRGQKRRSEFCQTKCQTTFNNRRKAREKWLEKPDHVAFVVACLADGEKVMAISEALGIHFTHVTGMRSTFAKEIAALEQIPPGEGRRDFIKTNFGVVPKAVSNA